MAAKERILVVEDDESITEVLSALLTHEGYEVETASNAADALTALRARRFDALLTDHRMPQRTGGSMLREADAAGLLENTGVLVVTATRDDPELRGWKVLEKPVDFDVLLEELHEAVARFGKPRATEEKAAGGAMEPSFEVELVLYVTTPSAASRRAERNIERTIAGFVAERISYKIIDLSAPGAVAEPADRVAFTPTLVKRRPAPRSWLIGDLRDTRPLRELLLDAGLERKK